jgi:predicted glycogen debranching enzyme
MPDESAEWLEADGLGGFASGTATGVRTRRYHALLLVATTPPTGRVVLVNGLEAWIEAPAGRVALSTQRYAPDVLHPDGARRIEEFTVEPWPRWTFRLDDGTRIVQEIFVRHGAAAVVVSWHVAGGAPEHVLAVRPLLSGRDPHSLHHENADADVDPLVRGGRIVWRPYPGIPGVLALASGEYEHGPVWYRSFLYAEERARGLDHVEDLLSPGVFRFDLSRGRATLVFAAETAALPAQSAEACETAFRAAEATRRAAFAGPLDRAADAYVVRRGAGKTIVAGYPWFADWGRDTFVALRGLCLATGRLDDARDILLEWAGAVSAGMLPNRFPDRGDAPEFNAVDAALWYVVAVHDYLAARRTVPAADRRALVDAVLAIVAGSADGTRHGIRLDHDGLLAAGEPGVQLTWMDAKVGDWVVTPRIGKPVEVEALWLNALHVASGFSERWAAVFAHGLETFRTRFWNDAGRLHDVVDVDHRAGAVDASFRPNQIFAVGGLPIAVLDGERARRVVDAVEERLWTPLGLRSLAPGSPAYVPRYEGGVRERDGAYHQGTVWPWLLGPFVEAWIRVRGGTAEAKREARARFVEPLLAHVGAAGLGHVSEIADAEPPHTPRGCPFQAWSVGELLRLVHVVTDGAR